jgi:hypothetical protein
MNVTEIVPPSGREHPNQALIGGPRLHFSVGELRATTVSVSSENFPLAHMRWASRKEAVTETLTIFAAQDRLGKVMPCSSDEYVVIACDQSVMQAPPKVHDLVRLNGRSGLVLRISGTGIAEVQVHGEDTYRRVSALSLKLPKPILIFNEHA